MDLQGLLVVCPLVFLAGFVDAIAGGGGIISLPAYMIAGIPAHMALGTNKLSSTSGTIVSTLRYLKSGYLKGIGILAVFAAVAAIAGGTAGSRLALVVPEKVITNMMLIILPAVAFFVLRNKAFTEDREPQGLPGKKRFVFTMLAAFGIGIYDGLYGPGTGTFLILVLTGIARLSMKQAGAATKIINLSSNASALVTFLINGEVAFGLGIAGAVCCIAGHYVGSGMVVKDGTKIVRPVIICVLAALFIKIILGK